jgi:cytoskeletal protein RodZ
MKLRYNQSGFSVFELVVIVAIVAAVGLMGYGVYSRNQTKNSNNSNPTVSQQTTPANISSAPDINSTSDLTKAQNLLDQSDPGTANASDSSQLDSQTNDF